MTNATAFLSASSFSKTTVWWVAFCRLPAAWPVVMRARMGKATKLASRINNPLYIQPQIMEKITMAKKKAGIKKNPVSPKKDVRQYCPPAYGRKSAKT